MFCLSLAVRCLAPTTHSISCLDSSLGRVPACHTGGPGLIPGRCSSIIEEVLGRNTMEKRISHGVDADGINDDILYRLQ